MLREERGFFRRRPSLSSFAEGAQVPVHYNPQDPARSVLHKAGFGCRPVVGIVFGLFFILIGWTFLGIAGSIPKP
jgi:hypothetical protein